MTKTYQIKCDRCGIIQDLKLEDSEYVRPEDWESVYDHSNDLCPKCFAKYKEMIKKFMGVKQE